MYNQHRPPKHDILRAIALSSITHIRIMILGINCQDTQHIPKIKSLELKSDILHLL